MAYHDQRQSMYSPQAAPAPTPPLRPSSAYDPYPDRSQPGWQSPVPPPRPSSAYIAPFPGSTHHESTNNSSDTTPFHAAWGPLPPHQQQHDNQGQYQHSSHPPLFQPQPLPALSEPQIQPPPRTTSLYDTYNAAAGGSRGSCDQHQNFSPNGGSSGPVYGHDDTTPYRALSPPTFSPQPIPGAFSSSPHLSARPSSFTQAGISLHDQGSVPSIASTLHSLTIDTQFAQQTIPLDMPAGMALHQAFPSSSSSSLSSASTATEPPRTYSLPTVEILQAASSTLDSAEDWDQVSWAQDVLRLVERQVNPSGAGGGGGGPTDFAHPDSSRPTTQHLPPALKELLEMAVPILIVVSTSPDTRAAALACYLKARLQASGLCDDMLPKNQRQAFKDFEAAARGGEVRGWFRLGRDYEGVNDLQRAKDCYERGMKRGDCECTYRMGMAYLLGQLNMPTNPGTALTLLRQACDISTIDFPQPSYVYGMLLAGELSVPTEIKSHLVLPPTSVPNEALYAQWTIARDAIERAAYFCYPPAQYKAGHLYEHAALGCAYDPLVSVNWYTYASKNGETEADMALSKWFLCGAEGHFPKNENLARTFAEKAARKGHPNGCFALGYYYELGVGGRKDLDQARKWYQKAANLGNTDAPARLSALSAPVPTSISMAWHESRLNDTLVRRRTQAKIRSDRTSVSRPSRRPAQPQAQPPQLPIPMPMSPMAQLNNINNNSCTNNQVYKSPRPDIRGDHPLPTPTSPAPRVGEIMSPNPNSGYVAGGGAGRGGGGGYHMPSSNSFPSRPPIPHQAFQASASTSAHSPISPESQMFPRRQSAHTPIQDQNQNPHNQGRVGEDGRRYNGPGSTASNATISGVSTSTSLSNLPLPERRNDGKQPRKEAQTFAEMGFVSKPVEEEGCVIM